MSGNTGWRLAVLAFLLCCVSASTRHSSQHVGPASAQCEAVRRQFTTARIGPANLVPQSPHHDAAMDICYKGKEHPHKQGCCTRKTERKYLQAAEKDFYEVIRSTSSYLKNLLTANAVQYQETILSLISGAENSTSTLFTEVHKIPAREHRGPLQALFVDLTAFIKRRQVNLHDSVTSFFDELFPVVWQNILHDPSSLDLTDDYRECLMEARQALSPRPFGEVPHRLSHQLTRAMSAAKSFLEALSLGIETINTTDHLALEPQCTHALTRLRYCGHCDGYVEARPCRNFCYNVMRGCLATVSEIDRHWNGYVDAVKGLTSTMRGSFSVESVLNSLHTRISEAILHAMETGHKFNDQVKEKCGQPQASHSSTGAVSASPKVDPANVKVISPEAHLKAHLYGRMETFMRSLLASKGFYRSLADTICSAEKFATGLDQDRCWNGHSLGKYNKTLVEVALDDQMKNNPEMEVAQRQSTLIVGLIDKLIQIKKTLQSKSHTETMQSDSFSLSYNGKSYSRRRGGRKGGYRGGYSGYGPEMDDEDYMDQSGDDYYGVRGSGYPDAEYSGNGGNPRYTPIKGTNKGVGGSPDDDIVLVDTDQPPVDPYPTQQQSTGEMKGHGTASFVSSSMKLVALSLLGLALWLNG